MPRNDLVLRVIHGEPVDRFPVWLMRQAGRYMKEYRDLRERESDFLSFCRNVDLAVKASLLPLELLGVDAVIIFSDIYDPQANAYVYEIIRKVKEAQDEVPVIGFAGAPFTLLSYLIEGGSRTKLFMWEREYDFNRLMEMLTETVYTYLNAQVRAGADLVQVFDSWTNHLSRTDYEEKILPYVSELVERFRQRNDLRWRWSERTGYFRVIWNPPCCMRRMRCSGSKPSSFSDPYPAGAVTSSTSDTDSHPIWSSVRSGS